MPPTLTTRSTTPRWRCSASGPWSSCPRWSATMRRWPCSCASSAVISPRPAGSYAQPPVHAVRQDAAVVSVLFALLTALFNGLASVLQRMAAIDRPCRQGAAPVPVQLPGQAQGMAGRHRHGRRGRGVPGHRAGHRPGRAGAAHLHHRAAVHPAGGEQAGPAQAAAADLVGRRPGHGLPRGSGSRPPRRRAAGRAPALRVWAAGPHRHRLLRGGGDHRRRPDQRERPRGGVRPGRRLRLRADRDAAEERGGGPGHGDRPRSSAPGSSTGPRSPGSARCSCCRTPCRPARWSPSSRRSPSATR